MLRRLLGYIFSSAVVATLATGLAFAAPVTTAARGAGARIEISLTQNVHGTWHHHHRIWMSDHHPYRHHHRHDHS